MESYDFSIKSKNKNVAFNTNQKNDVNMIFECDASRLAIYISLGHRDNLFVFFLFFFEIHKNSKIWKNENHFIGKKFLTSVLLDFSS